MQARYSRTNQALHWVTVLCMLAILPLAWVMTNAKEGTAFSMALFNWHKTLGVIVLLVTLWRIAHAIYWVFFFALIWMPVTGFLTSGYGGHATKLFNLVQTPELLPKNKGLSDLFAGLHGAGQWAIYILIGLHLGAVAFHLIGRRDGLLGRMLPAYAAEPSPDMSRDARTPGYRPTPLPAE